MLITIMNISELYDNTQLLDTCMSLIGTQRRQHACGYKNLKDRCRSAGASLLLIITQNIYINADTNNKKKYNKYINTDIENEKRYSEYVDADEIKSNNKPEIIRISLHDALGAADTSLKYDYKYNSKGKPYYVNSDICFSLAHSGDYVVCAVSDENVGIDIEGHRKVKESFAEHFFTEQECSSIHSEEDFYRLWTFKEAYGKYTGEGIVKSLSVSESEAVKKEHLRAVHFQHDGYYVCAIETKLL